MYMYMYVHACMYMHVCRYVRDYCTQLYICTKFLPPTTTEIAESGLGAFPDFTTAQAASGGVVH